MNADAINEHWLLRYYRMLNNSKFCGTVTLRLVDGEICAIDENRALRRGDLLEMLSKEKQD